jgi:hypothetical protein
MTVIFGELEGVWLRSPLIMQNIWFTVRVRAAATLALISFWGSYCYYLTKVVAECFFQKVDEKLVSIRIVRARIKDQTAVETAAIQTMSADADSRRSVF